MMQRNSRLGWMVVACVIVSPVLWDQLAAAAVPPGPPLPTTSQRVNATMLGMPLQFEANHGQVDAQVKFLARGKGYTLFLTPTESVMVLQQREATGEKDTLTVNDPSALPAQASIKQAVVRMKLEGANPSPAIDGMEKLPGIVNYFIGNEPEKWRTKIPTYARVHYTEAYPGIDLAYYGNQGKLEYDFIVAPGADPNQIKLAFDGASEIKVAASGDLLLTMALGNVWLQKPVVYQLSDDGHKTLVAGNYMASPNAPNAVGIQLAAYDRHKPLVIDPVLIYSSFIGGAGADEAKDIAVDPFGNAWVVGTTAGLTLSASGTPFDSSFNGFFDVFILKVSPAGAVLVWTYLGGAGNDFPGGVAVDGGNNVWVSGTAGGAFPTTPGNLQSVYAGGGDAFVSKFDSSASTLLYSTLYGSTGAETGSSIAVDASGTIVHIAGLTSSTALPGIAASSIQPTYGGGTGDGFVAKLNVATGQIVYATYLGGSLRDELAKVRVDAAGFAHVAGRSFSTDFPGTAGSSIPALASFQPNYGGAIDAVVAKLNPTGTQLIYSTYLGGNSDDSGTGLALDSVGNAVVSGNTGSLNFPLAGIPFQSIHSNHDYYVTKINSSGSALVFSTLFGGNGDDSPSVIALDQFDDIYLAGETHSCRIPNFSHPLQIDRCGLLPNIRNEVTVAKLNSTGSSLLSLMVLTGDTGISGVFGIAVDAQGTNTYVSGMTRSPGFTTLNPFQSTYSGGTDDGFVAKISNKPTANAGPDQSKAEGTPVMLDGTGSAGGSLTYSWTQVAGPTATLSGATSDHPTFSAPHVPPAGGTVTFKLVVCEGTSSNCSDPDSVNVHITNVNQPPVADAGLDQTVQEGSPVMLDGTGSYDPDFDVLTYQWTQTLGPAVTLSGANTALPTFTAPTVGPAGETLVFDLIVTDPHNLTGPDSVSIHVSNVNQIPVADAGPDQTVDENTLVTLNGTNSSDPDLDVFSYSWTQTAGPSVVLTGGTTANPTFPAPSVGGGGTTLTFQLVVSDGQASSVANTVNIHVQDTNDPPVCTLAQPSVASLWPPNHTMVPVSITGITDPNNQAITITFTAVTQDEPVNGLGDGDTSPDAAVSGNQILLRAERAGTGNGRVYVVHFTATDDQGGSCSGSVKVAVPHSKKDPAGEGPQLYNSFAP